MTKILPKNINYGFISISIWCLLTALGYVYSSSLEQEIPLTLMCFILFTFSTFIFTALNFKNLPRLFKIAKLSLKNIIIVNVTSFLGWLSIFYAIKYIDPSLANTMILACIPIYTLMINKFNNYHLKQNKQNNITAFLFAVVVIYLISLLLIGDSVPLGSSFKQIMYSIIFGLISSVFLAINNIHVKELSNAKFSPLDILTVRFIFGGVAAGIVVGLTGELTTSIQLSAISPVLLNSLVLVVIPQIAIQISLRELEPFTVSIFMPFMPVLMFMMEFFTQRLHPTLEVFAGIIAICVISVGGSVFRYRTEKFRAQTTAV